MQQAPIVLMTEGQCRREGRGAPKAYLQTALQGGRVKKEIVS